MILAVLIGAFEPDNLEKFENENRDDRIQKEKERYKRLFNRILGRSRSISPNEEEKSVN
jgi:hypothetical protein